MVNPVYCTFKMYWAEGGGVRRKVLVVKRGGRPGAKVYYLFPTLLYF